MSTQPSTPLIVAPTAAEIKAVEESRQQQQQQFTSIPFPESAYLGLGKKFAEFYDLRSEPPKEFFYLEFLTQAGGMLSGRVKADFPYSVQPRIDLLKIGAPGWGRKSFSSERVEDIINRANTILNNGILFDYDDPQASANERFQKPLHILTGAGSGEGLASIFSLYHRVLFYLDELRRLEAKLSIEGSTLLTVLIELFGKNEYQNRVLQNPLDIRDAHLVVSANTTTKNFDSMVRGGEMSRSGFFSRVLLAANETEKRFTRSDFPEAELQGLAQEFAEILRSAPSLDPQTGLPTEERVLHFAHDGSFERWHDWYQTVERTEETSRLDTYGQRLMSVLAFTSGKSEINLQVVNAVLDILAYQQSLRDVYWPVDAESPEAQVEEKVMRVLKRRQKTLPGKPTMTEREIEQYAKVRKKYGPEALSESLKRMSQRGAILAAIRKGTKKVTKEYWLPPAEDDES